MSVVTLFTKNAPTIAGFEFDAILEDTFEASVEITGYPIESGARAADHKIIQPFRWTLTGAVSNNPLKPSVTDFVGSGLVAGLISGSNDTRASDALTFLIELMTQSEPFDINAGDIQLSNMTIVNISRTKTATNENGLEFVAELQEYATLETLLSDTGVKQSQLADGDPSKSQLSQLLNKGEKALRDVGSSIRDTIGSIFG